MVYSNNFGQSRVGVRNRVVNVVNSVDADAIAFITAAGITNLTQAAAINTLVNDLKTYGLWSKMKALYPFVGGTATSHKFNLKDPRDLDAAYRLVFNGGWTHTSTGALPNGTTGYANPFYTNVTDNSSMWYYSRTNNNINAAEMGVYNNPYSDTGLFCNYNGTSGGYIRALSNGYTGLSWPATTSQGFFGGNRTSSTLANSWYNGVKKGTNTNASSQDAFTKSLFIAAYHSNAGAMFFSNRESAFASIGDGLSDTEATNFYNSVQKFQTTLGRQIGSPIVSDTDAQAFINAAGLTDLGQANAVNTLVVDLKAAGVWTKMKAIYPFVGGNATSHKFNLKDPRDLDAAFRLVFNGGWVHSATGALPNGTTGYADTKLNVNNILDGTHSHLSYYSRTTAIPGAGKDYYMMGAYDLPNSRYYAIDVYGATPNVYSSLGNFVNATDKTISNTKGLFLIKKETNNTQKVIINNTLIDTQTQLVTLKPNYNIGLGASINNSGVYGYSTFETAFASIGDGLTDTEASSFYTAVQKYQTSLGRQIGTPVLPSGQTAGLLDTYSGAVAAYSLRKLRNGYVGNAIRVRRSSDNAEQDITFDVNGNLDTVSLLAFVGSGNGFVTTWYDQSGNGSNLIQATAAEQMRIVGDGAIDTLNGKPALTSNYNYAPKGWYKATYSSSISNPVTMFNIGSNSQSGGATFLWSGFNSEMYLYSYWTDWFRIGGSAEFALQGYLQNINTQRIINAIYNGASSKIRINNGTYTTGNTGTATATGLTLGSTYISLGYAAAARYQEHIVFQTNQESNSTGINTDINAYYAIY